MTNRSRARIALRVVWALVGLLALALLIALVIASIRLNDQNADLTDRVDRSDTQLADAEDQLDEQAAAAAALEQQLRQLGEDPVVVPEDVPDAPTIIAGTRGPRGLSCIEEIGYPRCRGDRGAAGGEGEDGADSTVPGPKGDKGDQGPQGEKGEKGDTGPAGPAGPGVKRLDCVDGTVVVTYTDDRTQTVDGWKCNTPGGGPQ